MSSHAMPVSEDVLRGLPSRVSHVMQGVLVSIGIVSVGISIAGEYSHGQHFLNAWLFEHSATLGSLLNLLLVTVALFPGRIQPLNDDARDPTVQRSARCINMYCLPALTWFWRFLGLLYVVQIYRTTAVLPHDPVAFHAQNPAQALIPSTMIEVFSGGSTLCILLAYAFLTPSFVSAYVAQGDGRQGGAAEADDWHRQVVFWRCFAVVLLVSGLAVLVRLFILNFPLATGIDTLTALINGLSSAIALAFFVGRMDSKFVLNWQWCVPLLFFYAGIQVYSSVLYSPSVMRQAVFIYSAFTMKCVLFIFLSNLFETRRILYYVVALTADHQSDM